eukprot:TRINITY_DN37556_c0_g1_i1.p1 TRINITY_DN37556_c0_g1~~TRINITY_DN37556_c0_g1_i1.p1  ORF type:complete len:404 (-),score=92.59 TRINITY_DN37556_c0_g1_i1:136-1347(-)
MAEEEEVILPSPAPLARTFSAGGIPVYRGADVRIVEQTPTRRSGLPAADQPWFGPATLEIAGERWKLGGFLNFGAEGQTFMATREATGQKFAAKFCSKADSAEIRLVQTLPRELVVHPNFIKYELVVLDINSLFAPAHHIIFMEHIPNGELFDVLASPEPSVAGKPLSDGTSRRFLHGVISGMAECYRFGVTHRDLKPENLLLHEDGRIIIIDMGHAKRAEPAVGSDVAPAPVPLARTTTTNPYGTPAFNAPEVSSGKTYDCESSDVWSVGVIAFYLHGKLPAFQSGGGVASWSDVFGPDNAQLWNKISSSGYYPTFPDRLKQFINTLWRIDPKERPSFSQLELATHGDEATLGAYPGLAWLADPTNDVSAFIGELKRSCPNRTFCLPGTAGTAEEGSRKQRW